MGSLYAPDSLASPPSPYNISLLSTRDVGLSIPVNFVTSTGVSATAACFANRTYDAQRASKCISNLLATGFRRFVFDIYWDARLQYWSLCPVQLPIATSTNSNFTSSHTSGTSSATNAASSSALPRALKARADIRAFSEPITRLNPRQDNTGTARISVTAVDPLPTSTQTRTANKPSLIPLPPGDRYTVGPYQCSPSANLTMLTSLFHDYVLESQNTLDALFSYIIFNVHAAAPSENPTAPAATPDLSQLPDSASSLSSILTQGVPIQYLYTPDLLQEQRQNLNESWYHSDNGSEPAYSYFTIQVGADSIARSPNGWPSESYLEFATLRRLIVGLGQLDPQMSAYNYSHDASEIFSSEFLSNTADLTLSSDGTVQNGCFFDSSTTDIRIVNSSWAVSSDITGQQPGSANAVSNITACGISAILNETLSDATADVNIHSYQNFLLQAIWSWAPGEPLDDNAAHGSADSEGGATGEFRCAVMDVTASGRWRVDYCDKRHHGACRSAKNPYSWTITASRTRYSSLEDDCPPNSSFSVPRTALENRYLLEAFRQWNRTSNPDGSSRVWININSIDTETCWVSGSNTTCPYVDSNASNTAEFAVPIVAAIIVFILAALLIVVKCSANRQRSKRKRKVADGWSYEGVPS